MSGLRIAIVGATGLVGQTILSLLPEWPIPVQRIIPLATEGGGRSVQFAGQTLAVQSVTDAVWSDIDVAFFAASNEASARFAPEAARHGVTVIDKASHFRMDPEVPLIVPEVNGEAIEDARIIASPNCSTIQMVVALAPIRRRYGLRRVLVSTYQAVSGTGRDAMTTLAAESREVLAGRPVTPSTYAEPIAFNVLPWCDRFLADDYTGEEWKLTRETQKIFNDTLPVSATAVRVPVQVGHAESVYVETEEPFNLADVKRLLASSPSVKVVDDPQAGQVPTPMDAAGQDLVLVGRIRQDLFEPRGLHLFVVADNLRKGAATNAIQILELILGRWR